MGKEQVLRKKHAIWRWAQETVSNSLEFLKKTGDISHVSPPFLGNATKTNPGSAVLMPEATKLGVPNFSFTRGGAKTTPLIFVVLRTWCCETDQKGAYPYPAGTQALLSRELIFYFRFKPDTSRYVREVYPISSYKELKNL